MALSFGIFLTWQSLAHSPGYMHRPVLQVWGLGHVLCSNEPVKKMKRFTRSCSPSCNNAINVMLSSWLISPCHSLFCDNDRLTVHFNLLREYTVIWKNAVSLIMFGDDIYFDFTGLNYIELWPDTQQVLRLYNVVIAGQVGVVMWCMWELKLIYNTAPLISAAMCVCLPVLYCWELVPSPIRLEATVKDQPTPVDNKNVTPVQCDRLWRASSHWGGKQIAEVPAL